MKSVNHILILQIFPSLKSHTQIDPSCLEALPPEMQQELKAAYNRQQQTKSPAKTAPKPAASKSTSPFKINRRPRGRGRPPKGGSPSKKAAYQKPSNQPGIRDALLGRVSSTSPGNKIGTEAETISDKQLDENRIDAESIVTETVAEPVDDTPPVVEHKTVNLCGAVRLQDVKNLLREWMSSTPGNLYYSVQKK